MKSRLYAKGNRKTLEKIRRLRREAMADKATRVMTRLHGIALSLEKYSVNEIARLLDVQRSTAHAWIRAWNDHGVDGLLEGHRSGRPSRLTAADRERIHDIVDSGPVAFGLNTGVWTSPIVAKVIEMEFGVTYHPGHIRKLLAEMGYSVQRPTAQLCRADVSKQRRWTRYTYPNLKKKPEQRQQ